MDDDDWWMDDWNGCRLEAMVGRAPSVVELELVRGVAFASGSGVHGLPERTLVSLLAELVQVVRWGFAGVVGWQWYMVDRRLGTLCFMCGCKGDTLWGTGPERL